MKFTKTYYGDEDMSTFQAQDFILPFEVHPYDITKNIGSRDDEDQSIYCKQLPFHQS